MKYSVVGAATEPRLRRVLLISHVADDRHSNGGSVYTRSLLHLIDTAYPGIEADVVFFTGQLPQWRKRVRQMASLLRSSLSTLPSKVHYFRSGSFEAELTLRMRKRRYDLVMFDHAEMLWCLDLVPRETGVLAVAHNIESRIYEQLVGDRTSSILFGGLFRSDIRKFRRFELEGFGRVARAIAISTVDAEMLRAEVPGLAVLVVPPTFSYSPANPASLPLRRPLKFGLIGNFGWWPNRNAYNWFQERVWPHVQGESEFHVFGSGSEELPEAPRTFRHGFVENLRDVWNSVDLMVNPIVSGSGVNIKVAEAIYNCMPMLCTPRAVAGLRLEPDPAIAVLDDEAGWVRLLSGDEALALAERRPELSTRKHFHVHGQLSPLRAFLDELGCSSEASPQAARTVA